MENEILSHIPPHCPWNHSLLVYPSLDSTNTKLKDLARSGAPEGTVVVARSQTAGRGRLGRSFHSPAHHGIYFSLLLRPNCTAPQLMHLTCAAGVAVCNAVESVTGFRPGIKWINDLAAGNKKVGGILTELSLSPSGSVDYAIIGIGINCSHSPEDFPPELRDIATSLLEHTGTPCDQSKLIAMLISQLYTMSQTLITGKKQILDSYRKDCITLGKDIQVINGSQRRSATALDILEDGQLLVRYCDGVLDAVESGEVSIRGSYGYIS